MAKEVLQKNEQAPKQASGSHVLYDIVGEQGSPDSHEMLSAGSGGVGVVCPESGYCEHTCSNTSGPWTLIHFCSGPDMCHVVGPALTHSRVQTNVCPV